MPTATPGSPNWTGGEDVGGTTGGGTGTNLGVPLHGGSVSSRDPDIVVDVESDGVNDEEQRSVVPIAQAAGAPDAADNFADEYGGQIADEVSEILDEIEQDNRDERQAKRAEMEAAHERGEPYVWEEKTMYVSGHGTTEVLVIIYPDGTEVTVTAPDEDGNTDVVEIEYPPGVGPTFFGQFPVDGELMTVYEVPPTYQLIVVDEQGRSLGPLDEYDERADTVSTTTFDVAYGTDLSEYGDTIEVMYQPAGPPTFDTYVVEAESGTVVATLNSGQELEPWRTIGYPPEDGPYTQFQSPGNNEYYLVIDADGHVVDAYEDPPDEEWQFLFIHGYEDGNVQVDLAIVEVNVDLVGPEVGASLGVDLAIVEAEIGGSYNSEDGSWEGFISAGVNVPGLHVDADVAFGEDADGMFYLDVDTQLELMIGQTGVSVGAGVHAYETEDGFAVDAEVDGKLSWMGTYAEAGWHGTLVVDSAGATATQDVYVGAGIEGVGGLRLIGQAQITTDADGKVTGYTSGAGAAIVNADGEEAATGMVFGNSAGENWVTDGRLGTAFEERDTSPEHAGDLGTGAMDNEVDSSIDELLGDDETRRWRDGDRPQLGSQRSGRFNTDEADATAAPSLLDDDLTTMADRPRSAPRDRAATRHHEPDTVADQDDITVAPPAEQPGLTRAGAVAPSAAALPVEHPERAVDPAADASEPVDNSTESVDDDQPDDPLTDEFFEDPLVDVSIEFESTSIVATGVVAGDDAGEFEPDGLLSNDLDVSSD